MLLIETAEHEKLIRAELGFFCGEIGKRESFLARFRGCLD